MKFRILQFGIENLTSVTFIWLNQRYVPDDLSKKLLQVVRKQQEDEIAAQEKYDIDSEQFERPPPVSSSAKIQEFVVNR